MPEAFKEDFFERVDNIKWETEPEVYWMASGGYPVFVGYGLLFNQTWLATSKDGLSWTTTNLSSHGDSHDGYGGFYGGGWMRQGLMVGADPVWMLFGTLDAWDVAQTVAVASFDGVTLEGPDIHDKKHAGGELQIYQPPQPPSPDNPKGGPGKAGFWSQQMGDGHIHTHISSNGEVWTPKYFHDPETGGARLLVPQTKLVVPQTSKILAVASEAEIEPALRAAKANPAMPSLLATAPTEADKRVFIQGGGRSATGRLRKGANAGRTITMTIQPYNFTPPSHGKSTLHVTDAETGEDLGTVDCGITRTESVAYGHYVFCVGGAVADDPDIPISETAGMIAYTEDGADWGRTKVGRWQINAFAVGPRK